MPRGCRGLCEGRLGLPGARQGRFQPVPPWPRHEAGRSPSARLGELFQKTNSERAKWCLAANMRKKVWEIALQTTKVREGGLLIITSTQLYNLFLHFQVAARRQSWQILGVEMKREQVICYVRRRSVPKWNFFLTSTERVCFHLHQEPHFATEENWIRSVDSAFPPEIHTLIYEIQGWRIFL